MSGTEGTGRPAPEGLTRDDLFRDQAEFAARQGQAVLDSDPVAARGWLDRAHRLAPDDAATAFALATLELRLGDFAAGARLLDRMLLRHDLREGWIGLALARHRLGEPAAAAAALGAALARHVLPAAALIGPLAEAVAAAGGFSGWCGLRSDNSLAVHGAGVVRVVFDGVAAREGPVPPGVSVVRVTVGGADLLGSPVAVGVARRTEGAVWVRDGGLEGWAWRPGDAVAAPRLRLRPAAGGDIEFVAADAGIAVPSQMTRPRGFVLAASRLAGLAGPLRVLGPDGRDLLGSPLDPFAEGRAAAHGAAAVARMFPLRGPGSAEAGFAPAAAALRGASMSCRAAPGRGMAVVVPVYRGLAVTLSCLEAVFATVPAGTRVVVVDDATPEPELAAALDGLARARRIVLVRHAENRGFPAAANAGMRAAAGLTGRRDVVLLNSDTQVTAGWLEGLRAAVHAAGDVGTATPLSNDATILSYPGARWENPAPAGADLARLGRLAGRANPGVAVEIPTAVGFCMYLRRECLEAVGVFREDVFAQGYGEENDFCIRARHLGWRHVAVPGVYVAHLGGQSFGAARAALIGRNLEVLERLHPGYGGLIGAFQAADPLATARRRLDLARWRAGRRREAVVLVTHDSGGGVERVVRERMAALNDAGMRAIVLRPEWAAAGELCYRPGRCLVGDGGAYPNLRFRVPEDLGAVARLLAGDQVTAVEVHHLLGHDHGVLGLAGLLGVPVDFRLHDYASFCPRITLVRGGRYCGEPDDPAVCEACIADHGRRDEQTIGVAALRARSAAELAQARGVQVPSGDMAARLRRHFPAVVAVAVAQEADIPLPARAAATGNAGRVVCVIGGIGPEKGYDVLLDCARDAAARGLGLRFTLVGHTPDDQRLLDTGRVFVTGPYAETEAAGLVRAQRADLAFLPSIWPETWCFTLGVAWRAGLDVAAFDLGAPAGRIRATGRGWLLPLGLPAGAVNNALLALRVGAGDV